MANTKTPSEAILDTLGRRNRKLADAECCACGSTFRPARQTSRFCSRKCAWSKNGGRNRVAVSWWKNEKGYIEGRLWTPDGTQLRVKQHRFVAEGVMGRPLKETEDVHHKDGNKSNNDPANLEVIDHGKHSRLSNLSRAYTSGYKLDLSADDIQKRAIRAIAMGLSAMGREAKAARAAIKRAEGK